MYTKYHCAGQLGRLEVDVTVISVSVECSRTGMNFDFYTDHMVRLSTIAFGDL